MHELRLVARIAAEMFGAVSNGPRVTFVAFVGPTGLAHSPSTRSLHGSVGGRSSASWFDGV